MYDVRAVPDSSLLKLTISGSVDQSNEERSDRNRSNTMRGMVGGV